MKKLIQIFAMVLVAASLSVLMSSCEKDEAKYNVSFVFSGETEMMVFNAVILELNSKGEVLNQYECNGITTGYKTKTYTAHEDAVKVKTDVTFKVNIPGYGEINGENGWSFTHALTTNATTAIEVSITDIKLELTGVDEVKALAGF